MNRLVITLIIFITIQCVFAQKHRVYKSPSDDVIKLLDVELVPDIFLDPTGEWMLQAFGSKFLSIDELSQPELLLAGLSINPGENGRSRELFSDSLVLTNLKSGKDIVVNGLPMNSRMQNFIWSPNGKYIAFTNNSKAGYELWALDVMEKSIEKLTEPIVNTVMPIIPFIWIDNGDWLVFTSVIKDKDPKPIRKSVPTGPIIRESSGKDITVNDYPNLLKDRIDARLFEYYATSQLIKINLKKEQYPFGIPAIFKEISSSPDSRFLMVKMIHKPFSYSVPHSRFAFKVEIWDSDGNLFRELFDIPLAKSIPKGFGAVRKGARNIKWRSDKPATLYWVKALDGGDPNIKAVVRDRLYFFDFPFDGDGNLSITFQNRFAGIEWGRSDFAICYERCWNTRTEIVSSFNPDKANEEKHLIFEYNWDDEYNYPGTFMTTKNELGFDILQFTYKEEKLYLLGRGATPDGYKPFVDLFDIKTEKKQRLWQSNDPYFESPIVFIDVNKEIVLTLRESKRDAPNYFSRNLKNGVVSQLTSYTSHYTQLGSMHVELVKCRRDDSVQLSGILYTPPGYKIGDGMLPVLMWITPRIYVTDSTAGQVKDSPNKYANFEWKSPLFWVTKGYAVLNNFTMPIIGKDGEEAYDTYIEQLIADAETMVYCIDSIGIADINKIAVGGDGCGAISAVNLLAHTNLFATAIARNGLYNKTLTPYGFNSEQRTLWEAADVYSDMSPINFADKINDPLLIIHGNGNSNLESYTIQGKQMYRAIKGNERKVRFVALPFENENTIAKESVLHLLWETESWLDRFLK